MPDQGADWWGSLPSASLRDALDAAPALVSVTVGADQRVVWSNRLGRELFGTIADGRPMHERYPEWPEWSRNAFRRVLETGETVVVPRRQLAVADTGGRHRWMRYVLSPWVAPDGTVVGVVLVGVDETAEVAADVIASRSQLLADVTSAVSTAPDPATALQAFTDLLAGSVAEVAAVYVAAPGEDLSGEPTPPDVISVAERLRALGPPPPPAARSRANPWQDLVLQGEPLVIPVNDETLELLAPDAPNRDWLRRAEAVSIAVVPLVVAGAFTGALVLLADRSRGGYERDELAYLAELTARVGAAVSEVRSRNLRKQVAERLQLALLPGRLPRIDGLVAAARFEPGSAELEVGGDWWDLFPLPGDRIGFGIGDVVGRGVGAAGLMGQARIAMRAAGHANLSVPEVLTLLDAQLADSVEPEWRDGGLHRFATALYGVIDMSAGEVEIGNAGHPPLMRLPAGGPVETVVVPPGPPLGLGLGGYRSVVVPFAPDDLMLAFTDGLVESRVEDYADGLAHLGATFERHGRDVPADELTALILSERGRLYGQGDDDAALLLLHRLPAPVAAVR